MLWNKTEGSSNHFPSYESAILSTANKITKSVLKLLISDVADTHKNSMKSIYCIDWI